MENRRTRHLLKPYGTVALFAILHTVIILVLFGGAFPTEGVTDSRSLFHFFADRMAEGQFPYRDFAIEYPPVSLAFFLIPRLFAQSETGYHLAFAVQTLLMDILGLLMLQSLARRLGYSERSTLLAATAMLLAFGPMAIDHFDFAVGILVLAAIYAFIRGWRGGAWVILGLATMTKIFPMVIAPLFALYLWRQGDYRGIWKGGMIFGATLVAVAMPFLIRGLDGFVDSFTYHSERGLQIESSYASAILLGDQWGIGNAHLNFDHGAWNLSGSLPDALARFSPLIAAILLLLLYNFHGWFQLSRSLSHEPVHERWLITFAALAVIGFMLSNKVFSPQYLLWLYPLAAVSTGNHLIAIGAAFTAIAFLTQEIYPYSYPGAIGQWVNEHIFPTNYLDLVRKETYAVYLVAARNAALGGLAIGLGIRALRAVEEVKIRP